MLESCKLSCKLDKKSSFKTTLWECFGDIIIENLNKNIKSSLEEGIILCEVCGKRIEDLMNNRKYCIECAKEIDREKARERMRRIRSVRKSKIL